jgi:hypothetical protein
MGTPPQPTPFFQSRIAFVLTRLGSEQLELSRFLTINCLNANSSTSADLFQLQAPGQWARLGNPVALVHVEATET